MNSRGGFWNQIPYALGVENSISNFLHPVLVGVGGGGQLVPENVTGRVAADLQEVNTNQ